MNKQTEGVVGGRSLKPSKGLIRGAANGENISDAEIKASF